MENSNQNIMAQRHFLQLALSPLLLPISWLYAFAMSLREKLYAYRILKSYKSPVLTVCVGNISWGGTGKSPIVDYILTEMGKKQRKTVVLTRGYGQKFDNYPLLLNSNLLMQYNSPGNNFIGTSAKKKLSGESANNSDEMSFFPDEALMLIKKHPHTDFLIDPKRMRAAQKIKKQEQGVQTNNEYIYADLLLMDDGFQHFALERDYNFVLLDKDDFFPQNSLGFLWEKKQNWNRVIPLGSWREEKKALHRASIFLLKCPECEWLSIRESVIKKILKYQKPLFIFQIILDALENIFTEDNSVDAQNKKQDSTGSKKKEKTPYSDDFMKNKQSYALLCAVGNPEQVQKSVEKFIGYSPTTTLFFADHHDFKKECTKLHQVLKEMPIICTEKDAVKLEHLEELRHAPHSIYAVKSHVQFYHSEFYEKIPPLLQLPISPVSSPLFVPTESDFDHWIETHLNIGTDSKF